VEGPGRGTDIAAASAAPMVPDDRAKAVEELRPSGYQRCSLAGTYDWAQR
jgi:hypothetical protein